MNYSSLQADERRLLSLTDLGCYLSTHDLVYLGKQLNLELAHKKRAYLLQAIFLHVRNTSQEKNLIETLSMLIERKEKSLRALLENYPHSHALLNRQLLTLQTNQQRLRATNALAIKECHGQD